MTYQLVCLFLFPLPPLLATAGGQSLWQEAQLLLWFFQVAVAAQEGKSPSLPCIWLSAGGCRRFMNDLQKHYCFQKRGVDFQSGLSHLTWRALHSADINPTLLIDVYLPC